MEPPVPALSPLLEFNKVLVKLSPASQVAYTASVRLTRHHLVVICSGRDGKAHLIPYPAVFSVDRHFPTPDGFMPVYVTCRNFVALRFAFENEVDAVTVFQALQKLINTPALDQFYAFRKQDGPEGSLGWRIYSPEAEFVRMGLGGKSDAWRITTVNKDFSLCATYPKIIAVPSRISDNVLKHAGKFRSKSRLPALSYIHRTNMVTITRCAQPLVGFKQNRSIQDERLVESIFSSGRVPPAKGHRHLIIDARPSANVIGQTALGAGIESSENYRDCQVVMLGIQNIHVMRDSINRVLETIASGATGSSLFIGLDKSGWLNHIRTILDGTLMIVKSVHSYNTHALVHCSDGWDRTAQLCSLAELCLDPYYRTIEGFAVLVEKEWMSFGFKFRDRLGLLSKPNKESSGSPSVGSQIHAASKSMQFSIASAAKSFLKQSTTAPSSNSSFTASKRYGSTSSSVNGGGGGGNGGHGPQGSIELVTPNYLASHEVSPVFTQFLDCVYQLWTQFPTHFEFSEKFLLALNTHLFSCRYGTFIFNNERERDTLLFNRGSGGSGVTADKISESVWDYFLSNKAEYLNPVYIIPESRDGSSNYSVKEDKFRTQSLSSSSPSSPTLVATSPITSDGDVLFPSPENARYWLGLYGGGEQTSEFFANLGRSEQAGEMAVLSVGAVSSVGTIGAGLRTGSYQPSVGDLDDESDAGGSTGGAAAPSASWQSAISSTAAQVSSNLATIAAASSWTSGWMNSPPSSSPSPSLTGGAANTVQVSSAMEAVAGPTKGRVASETRSSLQERLARTVERQMSNVDLKG